MNLSITCNLYTIILFFIFKKLIFYNRDNQIFFLN